VEPTLISEAKSSTFNAISEEIFLADGDMEEWLAHDDTYVFPGMCARFLEAAKLTCVRLVTRRQRIIIRGAIRIDEEGCRQSRLLPAYGKTSWDICLMIFGLR
jgi:hypothetical protein